MFLICLTLACAGNSIQPDRPITVASYNIRHGRGLDDAVDLERTADALQRLGADLIGLQEVDASVRRSGTVDQAAFLGERLGMEHAFGAFFPYDGGRYGMAVLSRFPIVAARSIRLPDGEEPRVALAVTVAPPGADTITVVNVHFDWLDDDTDRFRQASALATQLDALEHPWVLLGDFNDLPDSRTLKLFYPIVGDARKPADGRLTFPADGPAKEIDHIFAKRGSGLEVVDLRVIADTITSDHRPVLAQVRRPR